MTQWVPCMGLALSLASCGCQDSSGQASVAAARADAGPATSATAKPTAAAANALAAQPGAGLDSPSAATARLPLGDRLAREASRRPAQAVRPEQLREALKTQGVALARSRQVLASPVGAAYCEAAVSDHGLCLSLCEFADEAAAEAGRDRSRELFDALVPGRTLVVHGGSLLTLTQPADERAEREAELVASVFGALPPAPR